MSKILGGYEDNTDSKGTGLKEVTVLTQGDKTSLNVTNLNSLVPEPYDYIVRVDPNTTTEVYSYKTGGASGTLVATVTVVYTDATKEVFSTATRS